MRIEDTDPARHAGIEYPMEVGAPVFAPIKVVEEKDKAEFNSVVHESRSGDIERFRDRPTRNRFPGMRHKRNILPPKPECLPINSRCSAQRHTRMPKQCTSERTGCKLVTMHGKSHIKRSVLRRLKISFGEFRRVRIFSQLMILDMNRKPLPWFTQSPAISHSHRHKRRDVKLFVIP